jgi:hypothetical protein
LSGGTVLASDHDGYSGSGFVAGYYQGTGQKATFVVPVSAGGKRTLTVRFANGMGDRQRLSLYVNGAFVQKLFFKSLGDWEKWDNVALALVLKKGENQVTFQKDQTDGCVNLDYIAVQ